MEQKVKPNTLIIITLFLTIFIPPSSVHSHYPASSPSPAPVNGGSIADDADLFKRRNGKGMRGSFPVTCHSKCNQCRPCVVTLVRVMELEETEYYPQVWRCMCRDKTFSP